MDDALLDVVLGRVDGDEGLPAMAKDLVLAACLGDRTLVAALAGTMPARPDLRPAGPAGGERSGAFLRSITAEGFRGIGPPATLELHPGPGLTVVVGRNGSGKSSFAEALEVLLTGTTDRFDKQAVFRDGWRNLHRPTGGRVAAEMHVAGAPGTTTVERRWADGAALAGGELTVRVAGAPAGTDGLDGFDGLGWTDALETHRPFLAHSELEVMMLDKPSRLHDRLASVLGLGDVTAAHDRLAAQRKRLVDAGRSVDAERKRLVAALRGLDDERAAAGAAAMAARSADLDAVERVVTGGAGAGPGGSLDVLRQLARLDAPAPGALAAAADRLREAADGLDRTAGTEAARARSVADLLARALDHHAAHPDEVDCPVCGRGGALDAAWGVRARDEVARLQAESSEAEGAHKEARGAHEQAVAVLRPVPRVLGEAAGDGGSGRAGAAAVADADDVGAVGLGLDAGPVDELLSAWIAWATVPAAEADRAGDLRRLADHLATGAALESLAEPVRAAAAAALAAREDRWAPLAAEVAAWLTAAREVVRSRPALDALKQALAWLRATHDGIRNDRLRPIAEQAQHVWSVLRHESNVSLGVMRLTGSATQRRVDLAAQVDGSDGSALGVMSQGEVNALALSVFLPRATLPSSPFGFVVIDDPVQAMDPAKVDGLARVLSEAAGSRQVVVFTHDDRLPAAIRRLDLPARIVQVHRRRDSVVELRPAADPADQALRDARAVAKSGSTPLDVRRRVVPGMCRLAVEAALTARAQRRQIAAGRSHQQVEDALAGAHRLTQKAALALLDDVGAGDRVMRTINRLGRAHGDTFTQLKKGAHGACDGDPVALVEATGRLLEALATVGDP